jgi:hypothetical protein
MQELKLGAASCSDSDIRHCHQMTSHAARVRPPIRSLLGTTAGLVAVWFCDEAAAHAVSVTGASMIAAKDVNKRASSVTTQAYGTTNAQLLREDGWPVKRGF